MNRIKMKLNSFHKAFIVSFIFSGIGSVLNYLFQIILGHMLSVEEFGIYNSINSLAANVVIVYTPLSIMLCQMTAANVTKLESCKGKYKQIFKIALVISGVIGIGGLVLFRMIEGQFGVTHIWNWVLIISMIIFSGGYNLFNGVLQGLEKFAVYGFIGSLLILIKLIISILNIQIGQGVMGVVCAMLLSYICMMILIGMILRKQIVPTRQKEQYTGFQIDEFIKLYGVTFLAQMLVSFYINGGEIILMGYLYDSRQIGLYSSAATLGKISLYIISIVSVVLLPRVANRSNQGLETKTLFLKTVVCTLALAMVYAVFLLVGGKYLIPLMFGQEYVVAMDYIVPLIIFTIPLSTLSIIHNYFLGIGKIKMYTLVLGIVTMITILLSIVMKENMRNVPIILGIGLFFVLTWSVVYVWKNNSDDRKNSIDESATR